jgi:hypothetical protein
MHAVASCSKSLKWRTNILAWMNDVNETHERLIMFGTAKGENLRIAITKEDLPSTKFRICLKAFLLECLD